MNSTASGKRVGNGFLPGKGAFQDINGIFLHDPILEQQPLGLGGAPIMWSSGLGNRALIPFLLMEFLKSSLPFAGLG